MDYIIVWIICATYIVGHVQIFSFKSEVSVAVGDREIAVDAGHFNLPCYAEVQLNIHFCVLFADLMLYSYNNYVNTHKVSRYTSTTCNLVPSSLNQIEIMANDECSSDKGSKWNVVRLTKSWYCCDIQRPIWIHWPCRSKDTMSSTSSNNGGRSSVFLKCWNRTTLSYNMTWNWCGSWLLNTNFWAWCWNWIRAQNGLDCCFVAKDGN